MEERYSVSVIIWNYYDLEKGQDMFFVGIFDEEHVRKGIKDYVMRKERELFPHDISNEFVASAVNEHVDDTTIEEILKNPEYILNVVGTCYGFNIHKAECNMISEDYIVHID